MTHTLTPWQARTFLVFTILMLTDLTITVWGFLNVPGFIEANPFYAAFITWPALFINTLLWAKLAVIAAVLLTVQWFNDREPAGTPLHGGNVVCWSAAAGMAVLMTGLVVGNVLLFV